jgi:hypothetical protein
MAQSFGPAMGLTAAFPIYIVAGRRLGKGEAAPDDEQITMDALYSYLSRRARSDGSAATPQRFVQGGVGDLIISANPLVGSSQLDPDTIAALMDENWRTQLGAVTELAQQMLEGSTIAGRAARLALQRHVDNRKQPELNYRVRNAIVNALTIKEKQQGVAQAEAEEEKQRAEAARHGALSCWKEPTKDQWLPWWSAWLGWTPNAFDVAVFTLLLVPISQEFGVPVSTMVFVLTITLWTRFLGAVMFGRFADLIGRKTPPMISIFWYAFASLI